MENNFNPITLFILFAAFCVLLLRQCDNAHENDSKIASFHSETHDTMYMPGDTVWRDTIIYKPYPVYSQASTPEQQAVNECDSVRAYSDSLRIDSTSIVYYSDTVLGKKLTYRLTFRGKPYVKIIEKTIHDSVVHIENRKTYTNGFYLNCDMGASIREYAFVKTSNNTRLTFGIGVDYVTPRRVSVGYRYGVYENSHALKIGYKLF